MTAGPLENLSEQHGALVVQVEQSYGREGVWCRTCRTATPPQQVVVHQERLVLRCDGCADDLLVLPLRPRQRAAALAPRGWRVLTLP